MQESNAVRKFDTRTVEVAKPKRVAQTRYKVVRREEAGKRALEFFTLKNIVIFVLVVGSICFMLYNQAQLNELNGEIDAVNNNILKLQSEYMRMQSNLDSQRYTNVKRVAEQELGLHLLDQYQAEYVFIYKDDQVEFMEPEAPQGLSETVEAAITRAFASIQSAWVWSRYH